MSGTRVSRRDWLKLGGLGGSAALLGSCSRKDSEAEVRGIVFMVSDGMSHGVLTMAENFSHIVNGRGTRWWKLIADQEATRGLMETSSANSYVTDSAAASSAWGGGVKIDNRAVNVRPDGTESVPIMRHLKSLGHRTGLVTSTTITHATPAGFAAVTANRDDEHLIAPQYAGVVDILLGGGMKFFDPKQRVDSRDALSLYGKGGYSFAGDRDGLLSMGKSDRILGLFSDGHLPYEVDRLNSPELLKKVPSLAEMSGLALSNLLTGGKKFLLQVEGGRVDHGAHTNDIAGLLWDQLAFDDAIAKVLDLVEGREDILVVVTSDHGNANPGLNGTGEEYGESDKAFASIAEMTSSYESLFGLWKKSEDLTTASLTSAVREKLGFTLRKKESEALLTAFEEEATRAVDKALKAEGKPYEEKKGSRLDWSSQLNNVPGLMGQFAGNHTGIGWTGTSHTSDPTMISAIGPQARRFSGIVPNQEVHRHFLELLG